MQAGGGRSMALRRKAAIALLPAGILMGGRLNICPVLPRLGRQLASRKPWHASCSLEDSERLRAPAEAWVRRSSGREGASKNASLFPFESVVVCNARSSDRNPFPFESRARCG